MPTKRLYNIMGTVYIVSLYYYILYYNSRLFVKKNNNFHYPFEDLLLTQYFPFKN